MSTEAPVAEPKHRILREVLRNYLSLKDASEHEDYTLTICRVKGCTWSNARGIQKGHEGECNLITVNFIDLQNCLRGLSKRKKEAVFYNVIYDMKQKDVAALMGITTVSVGQYVEQACLQVAKELWPDEEPADVS